jgi:hypothetical protein
MKTWDVRPIRQFADQVGKSVRLSLHTEKRTDLRKFDVDMRLCVQDCFPSAALYSAPGRDRRVHDCSRFLQLGPMNDTLTPLS